MCGKIGDGSIMMIELASTSSNTAVVMTGKTYGRRMKRGGA